MRSSEIFISYSRKDKAFVQTLEAALKAKEIEVWVDWEDIPEAVDWWNEIESGITASNALLFVISPDSLASLVCYRELEYALANNKRIIPLVYREVDSESRDMHQSLRQLQWLFCRSSDDFDTAIEQIETVLKTDYSYLKEHTRYLQRAREWQERDYDGSFLLKGDDAQFASDWLYKNADKDPTATPLQVEYIEASIEEARLREESQQIRNKQLLPLTRLVYTILGGILAMAWYLIINHPDSGSYEELMIAQTLAFGVSLAIIVMLISSIKHQVAKNFGGNFLILIVSMLLFSLFWYFHADPHGESFFQFENRIPFITIPLPRESNSPFMIVGPIFGFGFGLSQIMTKRRYLAVLIFATLILFSIFFTTNGTCQYDYQYNELRLWNTPNSFLDWEYAEPMLAFDCDLLNAGNTFNFWVTSIPFALIVAIAMNALDLFHKPLAKLPKSKNSKGRKRQYLSEMKTSSVQNKSR